MALNLGPPGSPERIFLRLIVQLTDDADRIELMWRYYEGNHPLPSGDRRATELYRRFQKRSRSNYVGLVADSVLERLAITGFRAGGDVNTDLDAEMWRIWQANGLDADEDIVHLTALVTRESYAMVGPNPDDPTTPLITPEAPDMVRCTYDPVQRRKPKFGVKRWFDEDKSRWVAQFYSATEVVDLTGPGEKASAEAMKNAGSWTVDDTNPNSFGQVPIVRFLNRPRRNGWVGMGEFEDVTDIQDRMNSTILDRMVISKVQAYRQRWATGISLKDEQGRDVEPFVPGVDMFWGVEDENAKFGDFQESDITKILAAVQDDIKDLAAITRTPPHYLIGEIVNASGDALKAAETGLVAKAHKRQRDFGESWEDVLRLVGIVTSTDISVEAAVVWKDPENRSMAELADAAVKKQAAGVPWRQRMEDLGYTDQQIERMEADRAADALLASPPPQPIVPPAAGQQQPQPGQPQQLQPVNGAG